MFITHEIITVTSSYLLRSEVSIKNPILKFPSGGFLIKILTDGFYVILVKLFEFIVFLLQIVFILLGKDLFFYQIAQVVYFGAIFFLNLLFEISHESVDETLKTFVASIILVLSLLLLREGGLFHGVKL